MSRGQPKAALEKVLFYMDNPEVVVLSFGEKSKILAVATNNINQYQFFGARVSVAQFQNYLSNRFDLRFILSHPDRNAWYEFNLCSSGIEAQLKEVTLSKQRIESLLPEHGFFARDHTEDYATQTFEHTDVQRFEVDGNWDMKEFSKFHSQISDLYALTHSIDLFEDETVELSRKREVMRSFVKPWQGGGSYYGFFKSLASTGGRASKPEIKAIQWASPGYIDVKGDEEAFDRLVNLVEHYSMCRHKATNEYDHLWSYLQEVKLLKHSSVRIDKKSEVAVEVGERAKALSRTLGMVSYRTLKKMAGNDPVVAAKVLLAAKRRVDRLYDFFAEGRISVAGADVR